MHISQGDPLVVFQGSFLLDWSFRQGAARAPSLKLIKKKGLIKFRILI
jgi:hypothetical protein